MLVEIPDPEIIIGVIVAFLVGVIGLFLYYKIKPYVNIKPKNLGPSYMERFEYYERQLIDMKIRLDALDVVDSGVKHEDKSEANELYQKVSRFVKEQLPEKEIEVKKSSQKERVPNLGYNDVTGYVLGLITGKPMTSRDIQITIGRTREHTSRLMKKFFEDGYVERNTSTKPYTYSITEKGREKLGQTKNSVITA